MSPGSLETAHPSVTDATQALCDRDHSPPVTKGLEGRCSLLPDLAPRKLPRRFFFQEPPIYRVWSAVRWENPTREPWNRSPKWLLLPADRSHDMLLFLPGGRIMTDTDHQDPTGQPHRVAVVQAAPVAFDTDRTIQKLAGSCRRRKPARSATCALSGGLRLGPPTRARLRRCGGCPHRCRAGAVPAPLGKRHRGAWITCRSTVTDRADQPDLSCDRGHRAGHRNPLLHRTLLRARRTLKAIPMLLIRPTITP